MSSLQLSGCRAVDRPLASPFWGGSPRFLGRTCALGHGEKVRLGRRIGRVYTMSSGSSSSFKMNLNEYMVTLEKPLGIRFAVSSDGKIFVHALKRGGNAEKSRIIMVGDTLKKASDSSGGRLFEMKDIGDTEMMLKEKMGSFSLVLERPFFAFPLHRLQQLSDLDLLYNNGHVPIATWNKNVLVSNLQTSEGGGNSGFVMFSSRFLSPQGWELLSNQNGQIQPQLMQKNVLPPTFKPLVCIFSEEEAGDGEWAYGNFPLEEYIRALERSEGELYYDHSLGMQYSKITEQIYVGSCIQTDMDVDTLSNVVGITAILNFQSATEAENWGINSISINESCQRCNVLMINYPIRESDSFDMRKKLPFSVGLMLRLLKKNHRVPAIAWATWDLIAMVERSKHDGPATHAVTFVWNGHEGEDVNLVGDFTGNWKEPIKAAHKGGSRYEVEVRLPQGKYYYKYIVNGQWRHSTASPAERDESGNVNNVILVGDTASVRPLVQQQKKDANIVKVIERPLTESERFMLAKAARCIAFSICPLRLAPK
ncbi:hypothetical protein CDL15_Pgr005727 [Punica granatum]|uniref:AMP-activated protein kinase glycogen-binding domain-containing protein n=1 Tax=Punica granatum TaxID=22663 RepID=A0A218WGR0_PUNGR|nr:hypothetical protein CDL15_Pgr005727 [Punica granatum]